MDTTEIAGTLILDDRGLLLLYRDDKEWWEVPGGKVKEDESPTKAAVREAKEEIGVEVSLEKPFFSGEFENDGELFLWHGYIGETEDKPEVMEEKFSELKYFSAEDLDEEELAPNLRQIEPALRRVLKAKE